MKAPDTKRVGQCEIQISAAPPAFGTDDRQFELRAERSGNGSGRIYRITYEAEDASGNGDVTHSHGRRPERVRDRRDQKMIVNERPCGAGCNRKHTARDAAVTARLAPSPPRKGAPR